MRTAEHLVFWLGMEAFFAVSFSGMVTSDDQKYGPIGTVFALMSYLIAIGVVVILGAVTGLVSHERGLSFRGCGREATTESELSRSANSRDGRPATTWVLEVVRGSSSRRLAPPHTGGNGDGGSSGIGGPWGSPKAASAADMAP